MHEPVWQFSHPQSGSQFPLPCGICICWISRPSFVDEVCCRGNFCHESGDLCVLHASLCKCHVLARSARICIANSEHWLHPFWSKICTNRNYLILVSFQSCDLILGRCSAAIAAENKIRTLASLCLPLSLSLSISLYLSLSLCKMTNEMSAPLPLPPTLTLVSPECFGGAPQASGMPRSMRRRTQSRLSRRRPLPSLPVLARDRLRRRPRRVQCLRKQRPIRIRPRSEPSFTWSLLGWAWIYMPWVMRETCIQDAVWNLQQLCLHCLIFTVPLHVAHLSTCLCSTSLDEKNPGAGEERSCVHKPLGLHAGRLMVWRVCQRHVPFAHVDGAVSGGKLAIQYWALQSVRIQYWACNQFGFWFSEANAFLITWLSRHPCPGQVLAKHFVS